MVIQHRRQQVVGGTDGVHIAGKMQVDVLHGDHLRIAAAGGTAFDTEHRSQRRFAQRQHHLFAHTVQRVAESHRGGGFALARRGGGDRRHQHQLAVRFVRQARHHLSVHLRFITTVQLQIVLGKTKPSGDFGHRTWLYALSDLNIGWYCHN